MSQRSIHGIIRGSRKVTEAVRSAYLRCVSKAGRLGCVSKAGHLDKVDGDIVHGWAYDFEARTSARLVLSVADTPYCEFVGTEFRPDLASAGIGDGHHGFTWTLLDLESLPLLTIRFADTGEMLRHSERLGRRQILKILLSRTLAKSEPFQGFLSSGLWYPESAVCSEETVAVRGWAVPPYGSPLDFYIAHNGVPFDRVGTIDRPDVAQRLKLAGNHGRFGFLAESTHVHGETLGRHEFSFVNVRTGKPFNPNHTFHSLPVTTPIPDEARRRRVHGSDDLSRYLLVGATAFTRLDRIATEYFGKSFAEADAILDWGCGCGRVFQYLTFEQRSRLTGIDIDEDNIGWCKRNFPEGRFEAVKLQPPTVLPSDSFDFVFGISVLTHLTEDRQFEWLAELHRVTSTGATLLLSVNGETMWGTGGSSLHRYTEWRSRGFLVMGKNNDLDGSVADGSEYYNSFISRRYIFENWGRYFKVLDVLAGAVCNQQDLVVLQRL